MSYYSVEKALQAVYYLQSKTNVVDKMALVKLLFFADRYHIRKFSVPMLCDSYVAMRQGPVCSKTYDLIKKGQYFDYLPLAKQKFVRKNLVCKNKSIVTVLDTGDDFLSSSNKEALGFSINNFSRFDRKSLSKISHAYPEWRKFRTILETEFSNAEEMSYSDFFDDPVPGDAVLNRYFDGKDPFEDDKECLREKKIGYVALAGIISAKREENLKRLQKFAAYKKNWNGYGASPIKRVILKRAQDFLCKVDSQPKVFLTSRSTVQLEWESVPGRYLEIEFFEDYYSVFKEYGSEEISFDTNEIENCFKEVDGYHA